MSFIIWGTSETPIGIEESFIKCPACETNSWADIMVISKYSHLYFMPLIPTDKTVNVICKTCGLKRYGLSLNKNFINNYDEIKQNYKHPWFTYIGIGSLVFIIILIILVHLI